MTNGVRFVSADNLKRGGYLRFLGFSGKIRERKGNKD